ncbi:MAG TPA: SRPBCC family protein [Myxococcaceae bacterium]|nr:SRPBCC family protein [Myxococcaceae bacterium]
MTTERTVPSGVDPNSVRKVIQVQAPQATAWRVFTEKIGAWWPLAHYKIGKTPAVDAVIEPRVGGRWYERGDDGSTCDWGCVLAWEPHARLVLSWDINADWQYEPTLKTEIEVHFIAESPGSTRVELEHRRLDRYGPRREEMRRIFDTEGDWGRVLAMFASATAST